MEKLVKLLNQYEKERLIKIGCEVDEDIEYYGRSLENGKIVDWNYDPDAHSFLKYYIISKDYGFIKWLLENDKVDKELITLKLLQSNVFATEYESLLMLLAIKEDSIKFLVDILK